MTTTVLICCAIIFAYRELAGVWSQVAALAASLEAWNSSPKIDRLRSTSEVQPSSRNSVTAEFGQAPPSPSILSSIPIDEDHMPAEPATQLFVANPDVLREELERLLASDPETLDEVRRMLDEPDPIALAENLRVLNDTFAIE